MNDSYNCAICHETFVEPTILTCGHTYCAMCIKSLINKRCPMDNKPFKTTAINYTLKTIINDIYKDDGDYQKRIQSIELKKIYNKNLKLLHEDVEFQVAYEKILDLLDNHYIQLSSLEEEFGRVLTWTSLDKILKEDDYPNLKTYGNYVIVNVEAFVKDHHEKMSKSDIVSLVVLEDNPHQKVIKMVNDMIECNSFLEEFNGHIELIKKNILKENEIRDLHKKVGRMNSIHTLVNNLQTSKKHDIKKLFDLMDIPTDNIYDNNKKKWSRNSKKYENAFQKYRHLLIYESEDSNSDSDSD